MTEEVKTKEKKPRIEVKEISTPEELATLLEEAGDKLVVVDFFADWCGPCKIISPRVTDLANAHDDVIFIKVNVDECDEIVKRYGISSIPTFLFIKAGEKLDSLIGANYELLTKKVKRSKSWLALRERGDRKKDVAAAAGDPRGPPQSITPRVPHATRNDAAGSARAEGSTTGSGPAPLHVRTHRARRSPADVAN
ncbi:thioredoxin-2-like [Schistocerca piceifrons]|uniref:thioredoxin-2-like n=1 Tax=Schistocerca piceifrons TaxID=274613 RepID=UPI001F5E7559|nr:thioredoxin-2-like [Schistocerca piceifrons]